MNDNETPVSDAKETTKKFAKQPSPPCFTIGPPPRNSQWPPEQETASDNFGAAQQSNEEVVK